MPRTRLSQKVKEKSEPAKKVARKPKGELKETMDAVQKRYGNVMRTASEVLQPDRISTGVFIMDLATLGGLPRSRATMIVGERHAGKTMLACKVIASAQRQYPNEYVVFVDVEGTFDSTWAADLGVDIDALQIVHPETGEQAVDICDAMLGTEGVSLVVIDSVAALVPNRELDSSAEDAHVGIQARLVGNFVRKATATMIRQRRNGSAVSLLFLNQFRTKIGGYGHDNRTIPGGKALEFSTSLQIIVKNKENKGKSSEGTDSVVTNEHPYTITKCKTNNGPRTGEFQLVREDEAVPSLLKGEVDNSPTILTYAKKFGYYTGAGKNQTLEFADFKQSFGKQDECIQFLRDNFDVQNQLWWTLVAHQARSQKMPDEYVKRVIKMANYFE